MIETCVVAVALVVVFGGGMLAGYAVAKHENLKTAVTELKGHVVTLKDTVADAGKSSGAAVADAAQAVEDAAKKL
jgi:outer membrane murein-binding lipoprotein Lpp